MASVLYVCWNNLVRSPAAQMITQHYAGQYGIRPLTADSAGLAVSSGSGNLSVDRNMAAALEKDGFPVEKLIRGEHFPKQLDYGLLDNYDVVLAMEREQVEFLQSRCHNLEGKLSTLPGYLGIDKEIDDPVRFIVKRRPALSKMIAGTKGGVECGDIEGLARLFEEKEREIREYATGLISRLYGEDKVSIQKIGEWDSMAPRLK